MLAKKHHQPTLIKKKPSTSTKKMFGRHWPKIAYADANLENLVDVDQKLASIMPKATSVDVWLDCYYFITYCEFS